MKNISLLLLLLLLGGALANVPSCWQPTFLTNISAYTFISGHQNYNTTAYTKQLSSGDLDAAALARMGATGYEFVDAVQYQEADLDRGFAAMFYDTDINRYYAVFQFTRDDAPGHWLYAYPGLKKSIVGGQEYYYRGTGDNDLRDDGEVYVYMNNGSFATPIYAKKLLGSQTMSYSILHFGDSNTTREFRLGACGSAIVDQDINSAEGLVNGTLALGALNDGAFKFGNKSASLQCMARFDSVGQKTLAYDFYGECSSQEGDVLFLTYEGSKKCGSVADLDGVKCEVDGNQNGDCTTSASTNTTFNVTSDTPRYFNFYKRAEDGLYMYRGEIFGESCEYNENSQGEGIDIFTKKENSKKLYIFPEHNDADLLNFEFTDWLNELWGLSEFETGVRVRAGRLRYVAPMNVKEMPLNTIEFLDEIDGSGLCGVGQEWTFKGVIGRNSTHYFNYSASCDKGSFTDSSSIQATPNYANWGADSRSLINSCIPLPDAPIGRNIEKNTIERYFVYQYDITRMLPTAGIDTIAQNSAFALNYSYIETEEGNCSIGGLPYGNYSYYCAVPDGYYGDNSGFFLLNQDLMLIEVPFQKERTLYININITEQGAPVPGIKCKGNYDYDTSNAFGTCTLRTAANSDESITLTGLPDGDSFVLNATIGDYYNSEQLGDDGQTNYCTYFDGYYKFWLDLDQRTIYFKVAGQRANGDLIPFVGYYIDGDKKGITNKYGFESYLMPFNALVHTLTTEKSGWTNGTATFDYRDRDEFITAVMSPTDKEASIEQDLGEPITDFSGLEQILFTPFVGSLLIIGALVVIVAVFTGMFAVAALIGALAAIGLVWAGTLPVWFGVMIIILTMGLAYVFFSGAM